MSFLAARCSKGTLVFSFDNGFSLKSFSIDEFPSYESDELKKAAHGHMSLKSQESFETSLILELDVSVP